MPQWCSVRAQFSRTQHARGRRRYKLYKRYTQAAQAPHLVEHFVDALRALLRREAGGQSVPQSLLHRQVHVQKVVLRPYRMEIRTGSTRTHASAEG